MLGMTRMWHHSFKNIQILSFLFLMNWIIVHGIGEYNLCFQGETGFQILCSQAPLCDVSSVMNQFSLTLKSREDWCPFLWGLFVNLCYSTVFLIMQFEHCLILHNRTLCVLSLALSHSSSLLFFLYWQWFLLCRSLQCLTCGPSGGITR
jgi:hypothetical protein